MSHSYITENTELSDILAQLLKPAGALCMDPIQNDGMTEESDLALTLRLLLGPDSKLKPKSAITPTAAEFKKDPGHHSP